MQFSDGSANDGAEQAKTQTARQGVSGGRPSESPGMSPPPTRWFPRRKAEVIAAVKSGRLSLEAALERYAISVDEYLSWQQQASRFGLAGLRIKGSQQRRRVARRSLDD